jgi:halimadienyl-diphosphate synthase
MPNWYEELIALFKDQIGKGEMAGTAYDTAWVASIPDPDRPDRPAFPQALEWLRLHQHSDGSWGADVEYFHDRVLSTLIACLVLAQWHPDEWIDYQLEAGVKSLWRYTTRLSKDPCEPIGFELILPTLLNQAKDMGFALPYAQYDPYVAERERKISLIPRELLYSRYVTSTFSLEFLGREAQPAKMDGNLLESNYSVATSPSATCFYWLQTQDVRAMHYLDRLVKTKQGAIPAVDPIDIFERAWALRNLFQVADRYPDSVLWHLDALAKAWNPGGMAYNRFVATPDLDNTAVTFTALKYGEYDPEPDIFTRYELDDHFMCYAYERNPSISAHIHLLEALGTCRNWPGRARMVKKIESFLIQNRTYSTFWYDKWHISPYYTTAHGITAAIPTMPEMVENAIEWIIQTQRLDGSWGYFSNSTAEETAYCLQALSWCKRHGVRIPRAIIQRGSEYLADSVERKSKSYRPLWISKTLYAPTWVIHSSVLSALAMCNMG